MKTLLLLRHGKSGGYDTGCPDHDRPLKPRGRRDGPRMARLLDANGIAPELILASTARRASETADAVATTLGDPCRVERYRELYLAEPEEIAEVLRRAADGERVMVVGHNPGLELLLEAMAGVDEMLPTAALVHLELDIHGWPDLAVTRPARLRGLWRPREID